MNGKRLNILVALLLSGCGTFNNRTDSRGEPVNKNAPVFISPKTNAQTVNNPKANTNEVTSNKPAQVVFNAESYVMIKEKDLNLFVERKTNEVLLNIKNLNTNSTEPNKELGEAIDNHIKNSLQRNEPNQPLKTIKLEPVAEKKNGRDSTIHPFFAFVLTVLAVLAFVLAVGYFFFNKRKATHEAQTIAQSPTLGSEKATNAPAPAPATTEAENRFDKSSAGS